jgi:hypothetical protein
MDITHAQLKSFIPAGRRAGQAIFLAGAPGIGKSQAIREEAVARAKEIGREFIEWNKQSYEMKCLLADGAEAARYYVYVDLRLGQMDLGQLFIQALNDKKYMQMKYLDAFVALSHKDVEGMLFLDEFNLASRVVMGSCYQLILDKGIGSLTLAPGVQIVAAGNRKADMCNVTQMPPALVNRMAMFTLDKPTTSAWIDWACAHSIRPDIMSFLLQHPDLLTAEPSKTGANDASFATPRSWEATSNMLDALAYAKADKDGEPVRRELTMDDAMLAAASLVGDSHATMFAAFCMNTQTLDADAILARPESVNNVGRRPDGSVDFSVRWSIVAAVADRVKTEASRKTKATVVLKRAVLVASAIEEGELAVELCRFLRVCGGLEPFKNAVMSLAHGVGPQTPPDSPDIPAAYKADFAIFARLMRLANIQEMAKNVE